MSHVKWKGLFLSVCKTHRFRWSGASNDSPKPLFSVDTFNSIQWQRLNPFMPGGIFYYNYLDQSICDRRVSDYFLLLLCFIEIPIFNAYSVDPDQMPHLRHLIWVYTVCQCPFYRALGLNGLYKIFFQFLYKNICCEYLQHVFSCRNKKYINIDWKKNTLSQLWWLSVYMCRLVWAFALCICLKDKFQQEVAQFETCQHNMPKILSHTIMQHVLCVLWNKYH